jgi:Fimbrial assembly protein (PilN)
VSAPRPILLTANISAKVLWRDSTLVLFPEVPGRSTFLLSKNMIQLQLQETSESKTKSGPAPKERVFEMSYVTAIAVLIAAVLGVGFNSASGHRLGDQAQAIPKHRMDVMKQLRDHPAARPNFLKDVGTNWEDASAVWLNNIRDEGEGIAIEGTAISPNAVSRIISNLKSTGYFRNIEIKETYRDDSNNKTHTFEFQLSCEFETDGS